MKIILNTNAELVQDIKEKIKKNNGYCPCNTAKGYNKRCICSELIESDTLGYCQCMLYNKVEL